MKEYIIPTDEEKKLIKSLKNKTDTEALRIKRYLSMPDLTRTPGNPVADIVQRVIQNPYFKNFDIIKVPEIVSTHISFDLFDFPADHPTRSKSDTYYVDEKNILRTQTTVMWYYYLREKKIKERIAKDEPVGCFSFGKVYRKDEIDRHHMNVFHQIDGWYLAPKDKQIIGIDTLKEALMNFAQAVFGKDIQLRFNKDSFPYTEPSLEMEVKKGDQWLEVAGAGVVKGSVLEKFGVDSSKWNGWAFGPGVERFAIISMELPDIRLLWSDDPRVKNQLKLGQKFVEVSKYPPVIRDISFIVDKDFVPNDYFDVIRETLGEDLIEEVKLLDTYENEKKLGKNKKSFTYRIVYRSLDKTLTNEEVDAMHKKLEEKTKETFNATIR